MAANGGRWNAEREKLQGPQAENLTGGMFRHFEEMLWVGVNHAYSSSIGSIILNFFLGMPTRGIFD